jgi:hypothetical protein
MADNQYVDPNPGKSRSLILDTTVSDSSSRNSINQIRGVNLKDSVGSGIPKQVTNVGATASSASTGTTSTVRVTFHRDPSDKNYSHAAVWIKGYQSNNTPVKATESSESPATFVLNNTGEPISIIVQAVGNGGQSPLSSSPTTGVSLPKSSVAGYGTGTTIAYTPASPPPASNPGTIFGTSGQGWFAGPGLNASWWGNASTNASITGTTANVVVVYQFVLDSTWKLSSCSYKLGTASAATNFNFGIYDSSKNKLIDCAFDGSITTLQTKTFGPTTLTPGTYYFACSATSTSPRGPLYFSSGTTTLQQMLAINGVNPLVATAANATGSNVMPSTLGALTAISSLAFWTGFPIPLWAV